MDCRVMLPSGRFLAMTTLDSLKYITKNWQPVTGNYNLTGKKTMHSIVVVEDDLESLNLATVSLVTAGYGVQGFEDGTLAWEYLENNCKAVDVIILAKTLPGISGMELLKKIQSHNVLKNIPVIIQTVDSGDGKYKNAIEEGAQFYINKPIEPKKLIRLVKAAIRSRAGNLEGGFAKRMRDGM
jgi:DNA-binding response OmpR family regulator